MQQWTAELAPLDQFLIIFLVENCSKYFDDLLSGERSLPLGLLVFSSLYVIFVDDARLVCQDIDKGLDTPSVFLTHVVINGTEVLFENTFGMSRP